MNLNEYRTKFNNNKVFEIADKVNLLKEKMNQYCLENNYTNTVRKNTVKRLGDFFYWIFIHNVGFQFTEFGSLNTYKKYVEVSSINFLRIDRNYKFYLNFLYKNLYIIYPLANKKSTGCVTFR